MCRAADLVSVEPRLLPWPTPEGNPCYLVSGAGGGMISRLADDVEAEQLETATEVLGHAHSVLEDVASPPSEVRFAAVRLAECLSNVLRIAESRGMRMPAPVADDIEPPSAATD
ncbi:hypothetical protein E6W39_17575 [Kitasatospora acidiphila]|uniref:Uncharacterized protein n=1 Tax=Kitasatospora acidiphila TaxID=2567942 RepID=A0A540W3V1_9ACTN|nr:hypothetical protein [Kitasatospora acidiphila]TQF03710.1 hypothetical protein E6W39_17575 [Kitasatospora acidiphila]